MKPSLKRSPGRPKASQNMVDISALLAQAAERRLSRSPVKDITLRAVASDAETNVAMISYYFGDKCGLFLSLIEQAYDDLDRAIDQIALKFKKKPETLIYNLLTTLHEHMTSRANHLNIIMDMVFSEDHDAFEQYRNRCASRITSKIESVLSDVYAKRPDGKAQAAAATYLICSASSVPFFLRHLQPEVFKMMAGTRKSDAVRRTIAQMLTTPPGAAYQKVGAPTSPKRVRESRTAPVLG